MMHGLTNLNTALHPKRN